MCVGKRGEDAAAEFLQNKGQMILERNWRHSHHEIDLVTLDSDGLHIVEVKTRVAPVAAAPEENVRYGKRGKLIAAAGEYLHSEDFRNKVQEEVEVHFDIVAVVLKGGRTEIKYFPRAFVPMYT